MKKIRIRVLLGALVITSTMSILATIGCVKNHDAIEVVQAKITQFIDINKTR